MKTKNNVIETILNKLKTENHKLGYSQIVAIKNSKSFGQLAPGLNAILINNEFQGFLWSIEETTYNRFGGSNTWTVVYSSIFSEYNFREEDDVNLNNLYLLDETPTTISFGRRDGGDYKYVITDNWGRPTNFKLVQIPTGYTPLIYSICPELTYRRWNGKVSYRDIFVPKRILYPYAVADNEMVLCCTYDQSLGHISAYWDGEMVCWKVNKCPCYLSWRFLPKDKEELINKINSKNSEDVKEPTEEEYTSSDNESSKRRRPRKNLE